MVDIMIDVGIFVVFIVGIWFSYRLFMRGNTDEEKVAALLPSGFKPDLFHTASGARCTQPASCPRHQGDGAGHLTAPPAGS